MKILMCSYIIGIPRRKTPRNDIIAVRMNSHFIHKLSGIVSCINFPHKLKETLIPPTSVDSYKPGY